MIVVPYQSEWPLLFTAEQQQLQELLSTRIVQLEHIGSTAVPGLAAKPVLDLLLEVTAPDLHWLGHPAQRQALAGLGYQAKGENGISGRRYFQKGGMQRTHHLHAFATGDVHLWQHRAFRDYLIAHPSVAAVYAEIKIQAGTHSQHNNLKYMAAKQPFFDTHLAQALAWYQNQQSGLTALIQR